MKYFLKKKSWREVHQLGLSSVVSCNVNVTYWLGGAFEACLIILIQNASVLILTSISMLS